ncbi:hypothetical protein GCM10023149_36320 [Mucilaginibacter gynuensis]|uniref:DUF748 domain-containing protein n=1 Tax=Mucilaginibacter gynuensis TaxID=1302236 RepID=A0ABP8GXE6_9SPHI
MALKFLKHKWQRILLYSTLIFIGALVAFAIFINSYFSPLLEDKIKSSIHEASDGLYKADFAHAELHLFQRRITIDSATLKVDSAVYNKKKKQGIAPNNLYDLKVQRLILSGIRPFKFYFTKKLVVGKVVMDQPELDMSYQLNHTKDTTNDKRTVWQKISKTMKSIRVGEILFNEVKFRHTDYSGKRALRTELREMNLHAVDLFIDSTTQNDTSRFFYCRDINTEINHYSGKTPDGLYAYKIKNLKLSTQTSQLNIVGLTFKPLNSVLFFTKTHSDKFTLTLDTLQLNRFDFLNYHKYRSVSASSIIFTNGTLSVFGAPNKVPNLTADKVSSFPHVALRKLNFGLKVDTILLKNMHVTYSEFNKKSKKAGTLSFSNTNGHIYNITNKEEALKNNAITNIKLTTYFMDRGRLDVAIKLNLLDKDAAFSYSGTLGPMKLSALNKAIVPLSLVKATSGNLDRFTFDMNVNRHVAKGKVTLLYNDLKINVMKLDEDDGKLKKKGLMSLIANMLVLKRNNPDDPGKAPRSANVTYVRPVSYPFFKIMWKALFVGVKECVGVSEEMEKKANARMSEKDLEKEKKAKEEKKKKR